MLAFEIETKVKKLVSEILDPIAAQSHTNMTDLKDVKVKNEYLIKKVEEIDRHVKVDLNLKNNLKDINKRIRVMVSHSHG